MRIVIGLLAVTAACSGDDGMLPVGGGGTDGGGIIFPDGTVAQSDAGTDGQTGSDGGTTGGTDEVLAGRVCLVNDPRNLNTCADTGAGGFTVELGDATATTAADGTFTILGGGDVFKVSGATIETSYMEVSDYEIPAIPTTLYNQMVAANLNVLPNPGEGALFVQVVADGFGVVGATAETTPTGFWRPFYDSQGSVTNWNRLGTASMPETDGSTVWVPGLDVGSVDVSVTYDGDTIGRTGLPIFDGGLTFVTIIFDKPAVIN